MSIAIVSYTAAHEAAVREFNARLRAKGATWAFPDSCVPQWLPRREGNTLYQEYFLAVENGLVVRGGYILKRQRFLVNGNLLEIGDYRLPLSEGLIDRSFALVALDLACDNLRRLPMSYGLGFGGEHTHTADYARAMRWSIATVPFYFRIVHPATFLRNIRSLRTSRFRCALFDILAASGLGWLGITAMKATRPRRRFRPPLECLQVAEFPGTVDNIWEKCKDDYAFIAVRDCSVLRTLYPADDPRFIRLLVRRGNTVVGWAVLLNTPMTNHKQFGGMQVGTLVDCLASPADAADVVACAAQVLEHGGADILVSNQSSETWCQALCASGFLAGPSNFGLTASPALAKQIGPIRDRMPTFHLNRGDGDGPIHL